MVTYKEIPGFPGYRVGDDGTVWTRQPNAMGPVDETGEWRQLKGGITTGGYRQIGLWRDGKKYFTSAHALVLSAFVGPRPEGMEVCHNNGVKLDNRLCNLRWGTRSENMADRLVQGWKPNVRLSRSEVEEIREDYRRGVLRRVTAERLGICISTVSDIRHGRRRVHY
jgi:hypothetical protein